MIAHYFYGIRFDLATKEEGKGDCCLVLLNDPGIKMRKGQYKGSFPLDFIH